MKQFYNFNERQTDPSKYKWGLFYWNPEDKRIFVPKRAGIGKTFNFANPLTYLVLTAIILAVYFLSKR